MAYYKQPGYGVEVHEGHGRAGGVVQVCFVWDVAWRGLFVHLPYEVGIIYQGRVYCVWTCWGCAGWLRCLKRLDCYGFDGHGSSWSGCIG